MNGWLLAIALLAVYVLFVFWIVQTGRLQKWNLSLMLGLVLMVRTQRGKKLLDTLAKPRRLWNFFGDAGIALTMVGMLLITVFFVWSVYIVLQPDSGVPALGASEILVIPGVNPFVPLWYGIIALIITLVVHEGGHGVLARANNLRVKSLGLLFAVVPIGAFVEPDEEDLRSAPRRERLRVYGAGPMVNLTVALVTLIGFSAMVGALEPHPGVHATVVKDGPLDKAGAPDLVIIEVIQSNNSTTVREPKDVLSALEGSAPGDFVSVGTRGQVFYNVTLGSMWDNLDAKQQDEVFRTNVSRAEVLQHTPRLGLGYEDGVVKNAIAHPFTEGDGILYLISLPIGEVRGAPILSKYLPTFYESPFDADWFWPAANLLFWVFWINLMVGLTNILPMIPLDGGHIFRDLVGGFFQRLRPNMDPTARDKLVGRAAGGMSLLMLTAFVLQIVGPRFV